MITRLKFLLKATLYISITQFKIQYHLITNVCLYVSCMFTRGFTDFHSYNLKYDGFTQTEAPLLRATVSAACGRCAKVCKITAAGWQDDA